MKTVSGIDTLYFFVNSELLSYAKFWKNIGEWTTAFNTLDHDEKKVYHDKCITGFNYIGSANNFQWFNRPDPNIQHYPSYRIGFKNHASQRNLHNIWVQLEATAIYFYGIDNVIKIVKKDLAILGIEWISDHVSRADLNMFINYDFSKFDYQTMLTKAEDKRREFSKKNELETVYFGTKKSAILLKMYNKLKELNDKKNKDVKRNIMKQHFINNGLSIIEPIWNIEFSLKREILSKYDIDNIESLFKSAKSLWTDLCSRWRIVSNKDKYFNSKTHRSRCKTISPWLEITNNYSELNESPCMVIRNIDKQYAKTKQSILKNLIDQMNEYNVDHPENKMDIDDFLIYAAKALNNQDIENVVEIDIEIDGKPMYKDRKMNGQTFRKAEKILRSKSISEIANEYKIG